MKLFTIFLAGIIFSAGLMISGMINPQKVIGFLDIFGDWDPSLAFVMGGAVLVNAIGIRFVLRRKKPLFETKFSLPTRTDIDVRLVAGAVLFGIGWGLVGLCPGPAIAVLGAAPQKALVFVAAMIVGMYGARFIKTPAPE
ncbi:MAG: YeeE/YedE family protein [Robiginitomaculum sp.]|nr:YeeE/YedE family protein [Robiginitomaculum sp.]